MDRIDIMLPVGTISYSDLDKTEKGGESSEVIQKRIIEARNRQRERFKGAPRLLTNSDMGAKDVAEYIELSPEARTLLHESAEVLKLSGRAYHRVQKLSRTIADLADSDMVKTEHILEALSYRPRKIL
jgi:magnesium chelatase family protein